MLLSNYNAVNVMSAFMTGKSPTRIDKAVSESLCGVFAKHVNHNGLISYVAWPEDSHLQLSEGSILQKSIAEYNMFESWLGTFFFATAVLAWSGACCAEIRDNWNFGNCFSWCLEGQWSQADGRAALIVYLCSYIFRVVVVVYLWVAGIMYLSLDVHIASLILNSLALGVILELDDIVYKILITATRNPFEKDFEVLRKKCQARIMHVSCEAPEYILVPSMALMTFLITCLSAKWCLEKKN
jgi:hypothetical protein